MLKAHESIGFLAGLPHTGISPLKGQRCLAYCSVQGRRSHQDPGAKMFVTENWPPAPSNWRCSWPRAKRRWPTTSLFSLFSVPRSEPRSGSEPALPPSGAAAVTRRASGPGGAAGGHQGEPWGRETPGRRREGPGGRGGFSGAKHGAYAAQAPRGSERGCTCKAGAWRSSGGTSRGGEGTR